MDNNPEKLFKDLHFQLLQFKKKNLLSDSVCALRQLAALSDVHCSEQNMSDQGVEGYKTELFAEYFRVIDSKNSKGLLPLCFESEKNICVNKRSVMSKECLKKIDVLLKNLSGKSAQYSNLQELGGIAKAQFPSNFPPVSRLPNKSSAEKTQQAQHTSNHSNFNLPKKKHASDSRDVYSKLPSKNKFEEQTEMLNKKRCVPPKSESKASETGFMSASKMYRNPLKKSTSTPEEPKDLDSEPKDEAFKNFDKKIVDIVLNEIMDFSPNVRWVDIAGLEFVKTTVQEIVIWPLLRPDIFTGLRAPPRGILLFGPPGTGKTLIGKCIATESNSTFFCISASSLASKWVGESEQMVRVLFAAARLNQPAVIFIDEIDSLLSQRSDKDQDFTRKLKTEFLVQFDGAKTNSEERVLVVGATNRPHELDEAARRRFVKRLFVPLPDISGRRQIIQKLIGTHRHDLSDEDLLQVCRETEGYSGSDVAHLCKEAAMGPIRSIGPDQIKTVSLNQVRPISLSDFRDALRQVRASVVADDMNYYVEWNKQFGSFGIPA